MSPLSRFLSLSSLVGLIYCFIILCIVWFSLFEVLGVFTPFAILIAFFPVSGFFLLFLVAGITNYISYLIASSFSKDNATLFTVMFSATFSFLLFMFAQQILPPEFIYMLAIGMCLGINVLLSFITAMKLKAIKDEEETIDIW